MSCYYSKIHDRMSRFYSKIQRRKQNKNANAISYGS